MILAFHGPQGAGKSSASNAIANLFPADKILKTGIKKTFQKYSDPILAHLSLLGPEHIQAKKQLELAISTWGETYVDEMIWSNEYRIVCKQHLDKVIITDDARTNYNLNALMGMAHEGREVYLFALHCPEEIRKQRVSVWRDNGGYTEKMLEKPTEFPPRFHWNDIDTSGSIEDSIQAIKDVLRL